MTDYEKKILFEALNEILSNQAKIMLHIGVAESQDDLYYTDRLIDKTGRIINGINLEE